LEKKDEGTSRMRGEVASGGNNLGGALPMNEDDNQIAQRGHDLWGEAFAQAGTIFAKGDVVQIVQAVLNTPVAAHQVEQTDAD
jgi:hypothetical protein